MKFFKKKKKSMYVCVKFSHINLNRDPYPSHPVNTYTYVVTIAPRKKIEVNTNDIWRQNFGYYIILKLLTIRYVSYIYINFFLLFLSHLLTKPLSVTFTPKLIIKKSYLRKISFLYSLYFMFYIQLK